jgi:hypothetical protein
MGDLSGSVADLVRSATTEADPRRLRGSVEKVLDAFGGATVATQGAAVSRIGKALRGATGPGAQVLALALGALVEAGAPAELAWRALAPDLVALLERATRFATDALKQSKEADVDRAIEKAAALARKRPEDAGAWASVPSRCLAAIACLTHSKPLRAAERAGGALSAAAAPLAEVIPEVAYLVQALHIVDDETWLVLAPGSGRGWRVKVDALPSNAELYVLLADALAKNAKSEGLFGGRPEAKAVAAVRDGATPKRPTAVTVPFELCAFTAVSPDGTLEPAGEADEEHVLEPDGLPADVPPLDGERIVLVRDAKTPRSIAIAPPFEGLAPRLEVAGDVGSAEVVRTMVRIVGVLARLRPEPSPEAPKKAKKTSAKKTSAKKTSAKKTKTRR